MRSILILGSGKMAGNIGTFFLKKGFAVTFLDSEIDYLEKLERFLEKTIKRIRRYSLETAHLSLPTFQTYQDTVVSSADLILECTTESIDIKKQALSHVEHMITDESILLSNSSSLLPSQIHPQCTGCHFFYPVELTGRVECICPFTAAPEKKESLLQMLKSLGLSVIEQNEENAFAVNRLLLPLQNEVFRLLQNGYEPRFLEEATSLSIMPIGQLSFMDSVGLDTIYAGVGNYITRMPENIQDTYHPFINGLEKVLNIGKRGKKNKNGLLLGDPLPWPVTKQDTDEKTGIRLLQLFIDTCRTFIKTNQITKADLDSVLSTIFQSEVTL